MIQKRLRSLSTEINLYFYDMVKICVIIIQDVHIFTKHKTIQNVTKILPIIYKKKGLKRLGKTGSAWINYISFTASFEYNIW